jgi:hypothetical protein
MKQHLLAAMITKQELESYQPDPITLGDSYVITVLAQDKSTDKLQIAVEADNQGEINEFMSDFPDAEIMEGDATPENHENWRMLAYSGETKGETSPLVVFKRGREKDNKRKQQ